jgi:hypothetical protein
MDKSNIVEMRQVAAVEKGLKIFVFMLAKVPILYCGVFLN